jgi:drug/metabolite transporter (DMT)-like permease
MSIIESMNNPTQRKPHLDSLAIGLLLACCLFWGWQQVLVKATLPLIPPVMQVTLRFILASLLLMAWCAWRGIALLGKDGTLKAGIWVGALFALEFICLYVGMLYTSASRLTIFLYTAPFVVALVLPRFVISEKLNPVQWIGLACAFAAVIFAMSGNLGSANQTWLGDGLALAAGAFWGLTTVVIRASKLGQISAEKLLFYQLTISAVLLLPASFLMGENWQATFVSMNAFAWGSLAIQTVIGAFASYLAWMWMLGRYPATQLSSFTFLTPVFALLFGAWWLGEPITASLVAALFLVGIGIVLVNRK